MNINDKVVYVPSGSRGISAEFDYKESKLTRNQVYVINKIIPSPAWNVIGLAFVGGITAHTDPEGYEVGFDSRDFRKLEEIQERNKNKQINLVGKTHKQIGVSTSSEELSNPS